MAPHGRKVEEVTRFMGSQAPQRPESVFSELSEYCRTEGVGSFDKYGQGDWLQGFEKSVAELLGKEQGIFFVTGTMAQQAALHVHLQSDQGRERDSKLLLLHDTSHLLHHEEEAWRHLCRCHYIEVGQRERPISFDDLVSAVEFLEQSSFSPCSVLPDQFPGIQASASAPALLIGGSVPESSPVPICIIIELPHRELGGATTPWEDLVKLRDWTREKGIKMHMDGARLWEIQPYYGRSFAEICDLFDSVYVSFYKGLGGVVGSMLLGTGKDMEAAKIWRARYGGRLHALSPLALNCSLSFKRNLGAFSERWSRMKQVVLLLRQLFEQLHVADRIFFCPEEPTCALVHVHFRFKLYSLLRARAKVEDSLRVRVFEYLAQRGSGEKFIADSLPGAAASALRAHDEEVERRRLADESKSAEKIGASSSGSTLSSSFTSDSSCGSLSSNSGSGRSGAESEKSSQAGTQAESKAPFYTEWQIGAANGEISDATFVHGWRAFIEELLRA